MKNKIDIFFAADLITEEQYNDLIDNDKEEDEESGEQFDK